MEFIHHRLPFAALGVDLQIRTQAGIEVEIFIDVCGHE